MYAFKTENKFNEWLIFPSKAALLRWARAATRLTDPQILERARKLTRSGEYWCLFPNN